MHYRSAMLSAIVLVLSCSSGDGNGVNPNQAATGDTAGVAAAPTTGAGGMSATASAGRGLGGEPAGAAGTRAPTSPTGRMSGAGDVTIAGAPATPMNQAGAGGAANSAGASGGMAASAGAGGAPEPPPEPCDPSDMGPDSMEVEFAQPGEGPGLSKPTGEFMPIMENDLGIPTHTVIRPEPLGKIKHPIMAWGEGGCGKSGNIGMFSALFQEFASHGILVIADGPPGNGPTMAGQDAGPLLFGLEWAIAENDRPCSKYYRKLDVTKLAVSGQSCGGLMAIDAARDPRITTAFPYNSGLFARDQATYDALHSPMAIFDGGEDDIAYANGLADFNAIDTIPILFANPTSCSSNAHVCTFFDANAGEFGRAGVGWLRWHLLGDQGPTGKGMFVGDSCGLCGSEWTMMWKMEPM